MNLKQALRIVLNLAENNSLDPEEMEKESEHLVEEAWQQQEAIETVEAHIQEMPD